jgi:hypothetical protein
MNKDQGLNSFIMKTKLFRSFTFLVMILSNLTLPVSSQVVSSPENPEDFLLTIRNVTQPIDNVLEFEIWLEDTDADQPLELSAFLIGISFNNQIMSENPPYIHGQQFLVVPGSSQLPEEMQPTHVTYYFTESRIFFRGNYDPPGFGNGFIVPATIPGVRIATIRFINDIFPFVQGTTPDLTFLPNTTAAPSYISVYNQAGQDVPVPIVMGSNATVTENPMIVAGLCVNPPVAYHISGSLEYCSNDYYYYFELPNTEVGTLYTIFNETGYEDYYESCWGGESGCTFEIYAGAKYWVLGRNVCGSTLMNGSVDLRYPDESCYIVASDNNICAGSQVTFRAFNNLPDTVSCLYHWKVNYISTDGTEEFTYTPENGDLVTASMYYPCENDYSYSNELTMMVNDCPGNHTTWTGIAGSDWFMDANWSNGIPQSNSIIHIPGGCPDFPILATYTNCESIIIEDGGSFIGAEYLNEKSAMVKCNITSPDFHFLSSPLSYSSNITFGEVFSSNQNNVWVRMYHELTGDWINKKATENMNSGEGYSVQLTLPQTAIFIGKLSWGDDMRLVSNHNPGQDPDRVGWNLIGNPNPCSIDWDLILHDGYENSVYVWNGIQYISWNGSVGALENGIIPPMNGFFVKRNQDWQIKFYFNQLSRVHGNASFYKEKPANTLELKVTGEKYSDAAFIHFNSEAAAGFDAQFDARKLRGIDEAPQLFSYAGGKELSINELPFFGSEVIELGFKCGESGTFILNAMGLESFNNKVRILLEDVKEGIFQNLSDNPQYSFSYIAGESEHRFKLHFTEMTPNPESAEVNIYSVGKTVMVNNFTGLNGEIQIYDLTGRMILNSSIDSGNQSSFKLNTAAGPYIVKVITAKGVQSQKVVII